MKLRDLPSVDELTRDPRLADAPQGLVVAAARTRSTGRATRSRPVASPTPVGAWAEAELASGADARRCAGRSTRPASSLHTNLGPRAAERRRRSSASARSVAATRTSSTTSAQGGAARARTTSPRSSARLTGAEAALVVNNNAAAVLLALAALADGREVLVSRGELIEIGDGFRIPDVLARSGARLVEVGTTNRTRVADYERGAPARDRRCSCACTSRTSASSASPSSPSLASSPQLARRRELPLIDDLGSGSARSPLGDEPTARGTRSRPAPTSSASPATSCSAARRPGSSSAAPSSSSGSAATRSSARSAPTSSRSPRSRRRSLALPRPGRAPARDPGAADARRAGRDGARTGRAARGAASAARSRRPSPASAAARCRCSSSRASRARSRRSSRPRSRAGEPPVVGVVRDGRLLLDCRTLADAEVDEVAAAVSAARST